MVIYAAVRNIDGEEIPSKLSVGPNPAAVEAYCNDVRKLSPNWDRKYPVVRIAKFQAREI